MTVQVPTSPSVCFCTTWENRRTEILHWLQWRVGRPLPLVINNTAFDKN